MQHDARPAEFAGPAVVGESARFVVRRQHRFLLDVSIIHPLLEQLVVGRNLSFLIVSGPIKSLYTDARNVIITSEM